MLAASVRGVLKTSGLRLPITGRGVCIRGLSRKAPGNASRRVRPRDALSRRNDIVKRDRMPGPDDDGSSTRTMLLYKVLAGVGICAALVGWLEVVYHPGKYTQWPALGSIAPPIYEGDSDANPNTMEEGEHPMDEWGSFEGSAMQDPYAAPSEDVDMWGGGRQDRVQGDADRRGSSGSTGTWA